MSGSTVLVSDRIEGAVGGSNQAIDPLIPQNPWFTKYKRVLAMDCEMVTVWGIENSSGKFVNICDLPEIVRDKYTIGTNYAKLPESEKNLIINEQQLASVAIVGTNDLKNFKLLLSKKVKHRPFSYRVNYFTKKINGFSYFDLQNGEEFLAVKEAVYKLLKDNLVIVCGGTSDLIALNLNEENLDIFDLQDHFYIRRYNYYGDLKKEKISLKRIYKYVFGKDIQTGIHSAESDAFYTIQIFKEYVSNPKFKDKNIFRDRNEGYNLGEIPYSEQNLNKKLRYEYCTPE